MHYCVGSLTPILNSALNFIPFFSSLDGITEGGQGTVCISYTVRSLELTCSLALTLCLLPREIQHVDDFNLMYSVCYIVAHIDGD